jgi:hypothetical protein
MRLTWLKILWSVGIKRPLVIHSRYKGLLLKEVTPRVTNYLNSNLDKRRIKTW